MTSEQGRGIERDAQAESELLIALEQKASGLDANDRAKLVAILEKAGLVIDAYGASSSFGDQRDSEDGNKAKAEYDELVAASPDLLPEGVTFDSLATNWRSLRPFLDSVGI